MSYLRPVRKADFDTIRAALSALRRQDVHIVDLDVAEYLLEAAGNLHHVAGGHGEGYGPARDQLERALELLLVRLDDSCERGAP